MNNWRFPTQTSPYTKELSTIVAYKYALILRRTSNHGEIPIGRYIVFFLLNFVVWNSLLENIIKEFLYINFIYIYVLTAIRLNVIFACKLSTITALVST